MEQQSTTIGQGAYRGHRYAVFLVTHEATETEARYGVRFTLIGSRGRSFPSNELLRRYVDNVITDGGQI